MGSPPDLVLDPGPHRRLTPTQRRQATLLGGWAAGIVVVLLVLVATDWERLAENFLDLDIAKDQFPGVITVGLKNTLIYTACSFSLGLVFGLIAALARRSSVVLFRVYARVYIELFRGLPALLTIILVGFALPIAMDIRVPSVFGLSGAGILALALVGGAYMAETIRAGLQAVPKGQSEAARSLGMSAPKTTVFVVIPQAFRIVVPPLANEMILLLKDTALLSVLGATTDTKELLKYGRDGVSGSFNMTSLMVVGVIYVLITIPLTQAVAYLERRQQRTR
jgi:polar amino acid transport system permease protein